MGMGEQNSMDGAFTCDSVELGYNGFSASTWEDRLIIMVSNGKLRWVARGRFTLT